MYRFAHLNEDEGVRSPAARVTGSCEASSVGAGNRLLEQHMFLTTLGSFSYSIFFQRAEFKSDFKRLPVRDEAAQHFHHSRFCVN